MEWTVGGVYSFLTRIVVRGLVGSARRALRTRNNRLAGHRTLRVSSEN